jgi:(p)ppGpp synthase/HD superfamily hydrolase
MKNQMTLAVELAIEKHEGQMYGNLPYMAHLIEVDNLVTKVYKKVKSPGEPYSKEPGDEMDCLRAIAFLHDILEDTDTTTYELLDAGICQQVVDAVEKMSKVKGESYSDYIVEVKSNELARKVKLCDTAANLRNSIKEGNIKRINKYSKQLQLLGGF